MSWVAIIILSYKVKSSQAYAKENPRFTQIQFIRVLIGCSSLHSVFKRRNHACIVSPYVYYQLHSLPLAPLVFLYVWENSTFSSKSIFT